MVSQKDFKFGYLAEVEGMLKEEGSQTYVDGNLEECEIAHEFSQQGPCSLDQILWST
jgi:hypothetical protein